MDITSIGIEIAAREEGIKSLDRAAASLNVLQKELLQTESSLKRFERSKLAAPQDKDFEKAHLLAARKRIGLTPTGFADETMKTRAITANETVKAYAKMTDIQKAQVTTLKGMLVLEKTYAAAISQEADLKAKIRYIESGQDVTAKKRRVAQQDVLYVLQKQSKANQIITLEEKEQLLLEQKRAAESAKVAKLAEAELANQRKALAADRARLAARKKLNATYHAVQAGLDTKKRIADAGVYAKGYKEADKATKSLTKSNRMLHDSLRGVGGALGNLWMTYGQILPLMAGFAAAASLKGFVTSGMEFTKIMAQIRGLTGDTAENIASIGDELLKIDAIQGPQELATGMRILAKAGMGAQDSLQGIENVALLAEAGELGLADAAKIASATMHIFNMEAKDMNEITDLIAYTASNTNMEVAEMGTALSYATPAAEMLGFSLKEVSTAFSLLHDRGIKGSKAGTAFTTSMVRMAAPTGRAADAMYRLNISAYDAQGEVKDLHTIIEDLSYSLKGLPTKQANEFLEAIAGKRNLKGLQALIAATKDVQDGLDGYERTFRSLDSSAGYLERFKETVLETAAISWKDLISDIESMSDAIYRDYNVDTFLVNFLKDMKESIALARELDADLALISEQQGGKSESFLGSFFSNLFSNPLITNEQMFGSADRLVADIREEAAEIREVLKAEFTMGPTVEQLISDNKTYYNSLLRGESLIPEQIGMPGFKIPDLSTSKQSVTKESQANWVAEKTELAKIEKERRRLRQNEAEALYKAKMLSGEKYLEMTERATLNELAAQEKFSNLLISKYEEDIANSANTPAGTATALKAEREKLKLIKERQRSEEKIYQYNKEGLEFEKLRASWKTKDKLLATSDKAHKAFQIGFDKLGKKELTSYEKGIRSINDEYDGMIAKSQEVADADIALGKASKEVNEQMQLNVVTLNSMREDALEQYKENAKGMTVFWDEAMRSMQSSTKDLFVDVIKGDFDDIGDLFANMVEDMVANWMAAQMQMALWGDTSGGGLGTGLIGAAASGISSYFSTPSASSAAPAFSYESANFGTLAGKRAAGGSVMPGSSYLVGEKGPEVLTMGSTAGYVTPNGAGAGKATVNIYNQGSEKDAKVEQSFDINGLVIDIWMKDFAQNGPTRQAISGGL